MKKRQLLSIILSVFLLSALLPTAAFAATVADNPADTTVEELASGDVMSTNDGTITTNNGTVENNQRRITYNNGTVSNNKYITDSNGLPICDITVNNGTVSVNESFVTNNFGTVSNNTNGIVLYNYGTAIVNGGTVNNQLWEVTVVGENYNTEKDPLFNSNNKLWIEDPAGIGTTGYGTAVFSPNTGYAITAATASNGSFSQSGSDWTLSDVTANTTVTLTVLVISVADNPAGTTLEALASVQKMNNNFGVVSSNSGAITNNFGTVSDNTGTVTNNFGPATVTGTAPLHQFWEVTVKGGEYATNTLTAANSKLWIENSSGSAVFSPASGYTITAATTDKGSITKGADGKWTLTGVTAAATVTLTVSAVPKTGVNRDTGLLVTLALISGAVLVTALPRKKNEG